MDIMNDNSHRPWPLPSKNWIMRQTWRNLLFAHWPVPAEQLRPLIPAVLDIDTYEQSAWLGVVVFHIDGIYLRGLSPLSIVPAFPEINLRTYVRHQGKPGVFFLSLDVSNWASLHIAKRWYHLPYRAADISCRQHDGAFYYESIRKKSPSVTFKGSYAPSSEVYFSKQGVIDHWLTERYCLYSTDNRKNLYCGEIHHNPWPLQLADSEIHHTLFSPFQLEPRENKAICHFSKGVDTLFWNIKKIGIRKSL
ncbi:YqjF family protein [Neobacillus mesonae]|uniref:YqjF family protein n=1 Tax=Neobacillus mesonae TaxID=1193713 RepID=UPI00203E0CE2|nr:DUF2071 domain-containing protein [Neobacillus mesonae]MCM3568556.1 DUF2071 domain-containing protein [Neobacillus mesonae]